MAAPQNSPYWNLAIRLMDHFAVCKPLMTVEQLDEILEHDRKVNDKFDALGDDYSEEDYDKILDEEMDTPHLQEQQNSYEAYIDSVVCNFKELSGVSRDYISDTLSFYFSYYFGEGGPNSSEAAGIIYRLEKVLDPNKNIYTAVEL